MDETSAKIQMYVVKELLFDQGAGTGVTEDTPSLIDPLGLVQMVAVLEEGFDREIEGAEATTDDLCTIGDISRMVGSRSS